MWTRLANYFDPLRARLALALAVALVPIVIYDLILAYRGYRTAEERGWETVRQLAIVASNSQNALIEGTRRLMVGLGESAVAETAASGVDDPDCSRKMARIIATLPEYSDLAVVDAAGRVRCSAVDRSRGANVQDAPWFTSRHLTQGFTLGYFTLSRETAEPIISALLPTAGTADGSSGAIVAGIRLPWLGSLAQKHGLPKNGVVYLLDGRGTVMTSSDKFVDSPEPALGIAGDRQAPTEVAMPPPELLSAVASRQLTEFAAVGRDGKDRLFSAANLQNGSLYILFGMPATSAMSWSHYQTIAFIVGPLLMLVLAIGVAAIGGELLISRGMRSLLSTVDAYGRNELDVKPNIGRSAREIRQFAEAFAGLAEKISTREAELRRSLDEKDALLREVHHRVKNNLQIVTSFLNLQSKSTADEVAREVLTEARVRVRALALVHRYLYESADVRQVDFASMTEALAEQVAHAQGLHARGIFIRQQLDSAPIPASAAVPIALFITEALSNAVKHGYANEASGNIDLTLARQADGRVRLQIRDHGRGPPAGDDGPSPYPTGIGIALMQAFARQLGGTMRVESAEGGGTSVALEFPLHENAGTEADPGMETAAS